MVFTDGVSLGGWPTRVGLGQLPYRLGADYVP